MSISENKTYYIQTFGCQMNEHDSETIAGMLKEKGYEPTQEREGAGIIIMNTCSVRENADNRFFGQLGFVKKIREKHPGTIVAVCGCMMQQQEIVDTLKKKYSWVDIVFGTMNIPEFPSLLDDYLEKRKRVISIRQRQESVMDGKIAERKYIHKSFVNIMNGCNNFCTYCIVPYTRGREMSRTPESIIDEIKGLINDGVKEITLLGQNVNSYGNSGADGYDFADLIHMIDRLEGLERIRFMTSHPKDLSDRLIACFGECEKLCNNIHLPVQSGSSRILKLMNRKYTKESYLKLVEKLRTEIPEITITTDIIVGFPGETEEDFEETLDLVRKVRYDSAFTFLYSIRTGTPAADMEEQIPDRIKHERFERLVDEINKITAEKNAIYKGKIEKVLVDEPSQRGGDGMCAGRTDGFKLVNFRCPVERIGSIAEVRITDTNTFSLVGELI
ncbi:MAG: tRNA (N6-isopentenyl adenosine(37)-C2)-methylthiotransferase MiaB [Anaerovoracaceae bacterium]